MALTTMGSTNAVHFCQRNLEVSREKVRDIASGYFDDILIGDDKDVLTEDTVGNLLLKHD